MSNTVKPDPNKQITVAHYRIDDRDNKGRIIHNKIYPASELSSLMAEAISYGFDIQFLQSKHNDSNHILYFSNNGFNQR